MGIREANAARVLNSGNIYKDRAKNALIDSILSGFDSNPSCFEIERISDNSFFNALITDNSSGANGEKVDDTKAIVLKPGEVLTIGDIFEWLDNKWICVKSEPFNGDLYYKGTIQKCNNSLKFYYPPPPNENSILCAVPCIVGNKVFLNENDSRIISTVDNQIYVTTSNTSITQKIKPNDIFKIGLRNYQVTTFPDDISQPGLLIFKMKFTEVEQAIPPSPIQTSANYTLVGDILPDSEIKSGQTKVFTAHKFNSGNEDVSASFDFTIVPGDTPVSAYTFTNLTDNSCSLKANSYMYSITLRATDRSNGQYVEKIIKLRGVL